MNKYDFFTFKQGHRLERLLRNSYSCELMHWCHFFKEKRKPKRCNQGKPLMSKSNGCLLLSAEIVDQNDSTDNEN